MHRKRFRTRCSESRRYVAVAFTLAALIGCSSGNSGKPSATPKAMPTLTVAAASDLQLAFGEIAQAFQQKAGCRVALTFGSTGQLTQQIEHGFPVDIFAAANVSYLDSLRAKGLVIPDSQQIYARGHIVLAVQQDDLTIKELSDLVKPNVKHIAIANPAHAPYGMAARQALERSGLWDQVQPKIVLGENVRQALQYVETGNAEAGIVALSIAQGSKVTFTLIDETWHEPIDQALAIITGSDQVELAREFIAFLSGPDGRPIMKKFGFLLPGEVPSGNLSADPRTMPSDSQRP